MILDQRIKQVLMKFPDCKEFNQKIHETYNAKSIVISFRFGDKQYNFDSRYYGIKEFYTSLGECFKKGSKQDFEQFVYERIRAADNNYNVKEKIQININKRIFNSVQNSKNEITISQMEQRILRGKE